MAVNSLMHGLRSHRKSWMDAAAGELRRQLTYKSDWYGAELWMADRFYPVQQDLLGVRAGSTPASR